MKKTLLASAAALMAFFAMGVGSASAHGTTVTACVGAGNSDGSFEPQVIGTGQIPGVGLGLEVPLCAGLNLNHLADGVNGAVTGLAGADVPTEPPTPEQLQAIVDAISNADLSSPLAAVFLVDTMCRELDVASACNAVVGGAVNLAFPALGTAITLDGGGQGCFSGEQSGTGTLFSSGHFQQLEWTADYGSGGNAVGVISGTASDFGSGESNVTGLIGPGCGSGAKVLVLAS